MSVTINGYPLNVLRAPTEDGFQESVEHSDDPDTTYVNRLVGVVRWEKRVATLRLARMTEDQFLALLAVAPHERMANCAGSSLGGPRRCLVEYIDRIVHRSGTTVSLSISLRLTEA